MVAISGGVKATDGFSAEILKFSSFQLKFGLAREFWSLASGGRGVKMVMEGVPLKMD